MHEWIFWVRLSQRKWIWNCGVQKLISLYRWSVENTALECSPRAPKRRKWCPKNKTLYVPQFQERILAFFKRSFCDCVPFCKLDSYCSCENDVSASIDVFSLLRPSQIIHFVYTSAKIDVRPKLFKEWILTICEIFLKKFCHSKDNRESFGSTCINLIFHIKLRP